MAETINIAKRGYILIKNPSALEEWDKLYKLAIRVKEIASWKWLTETDIFGVQNPEADEIGFVSVMGMAGEYYSIAVYLGPVGLYSFWALHDA